MSKRVVKHSYQDPLSEVWICAAMKIGLRVTRTQDAFAHSDGQGTLQIATSEHLDADDSLAQMIFHELCHSLVEGPEGFDQVDWGLDNTSTVDDEREHATLRVQALLAGRHGLRAVLAPTTDFRGFYDALGPDPLVPRHELSTQLALPAIRRAQTNPWWPHLGKALEATAAIVRVAAAWPAPSKSPGLYRLLEEPVRTHATGLMGRSTETPGRCGDCAWRQDDGHCHQAEQEISNDNPACERFEPPFECQDCGACCRAAYHSVTIAEGDPIAKLHPELLVHHATYSELRRDSDQCAALESKGGRFYCTIYDDRPTCCREFENAGHNCITARRRLGLSL